MTRRILDRTGERRMVGNGPMRCIAHGQGYVMVRRPRAMPCVMSEKDWIIYPLAVSA